MNMKKLVVLTGAGMSAESGISTFRDSNGLWENHSIEEVATPEGWRANPQLVLDFYNARRAQLATCKSNAGHLGLAELEQYFDVHIVTQNVDNLHEQAGSSNILHLHGELTKACDEYKKEIVDIGTNEIQLGNQLGGTQMRPFIVWFGEAVPAMDEAIEIVEAADVLVVIGTSLNVYPAAGLLNYIPESVPIYLIDPNEVKITKKIKFIQKGASKGVKELKELLLKRFLS